MPVPTVIFASNKKKSTLYRFTYFRILKPSVLFDTMTKFDAMLTDGGDTGHGKEYVGAISQLVRRLLFSFRCWRSGVAGAIFRLAFPARTSLHHLVLPSLVHVTFHVVVVVSVRLSVGAVPVGCENEGKVSVVETLSKTTVQNLF